MLAFNPAGVDQADAANPVTGNSGDTNRGGESVESDARDEGYLYWLAWVVNNTVSLHSTSDAEGPLRRVGVSLNCETVTQLLLPNAGGVSFLPPELLGSARRSAHDGLHRGAAEPRRAPGSAGAAQHAAGRRRG